MGPTDPYIQPRSSCWTGEAAITADTSGTRTLAGIFNYRYSQAYSSRRLKKVGMSTAAFVGVRISELPAAIAKWIVEHREVIRAEHLIVTR